ncbi:MAG: restriction endonuclease subunit S, partial [Nodosilinea sp.]
MTVEQLIIDKLDLWTSATTQKATSGRGRNGKLELTGLKKLRELILELAVRGKLVPQDPNDEPASLLLEKIAAEKARLVKEGKIKKPKALPEIAENEKPFELPEGWAYGYISQVANNDKYSIKRGPFGSALKKSYFVSSGYKVYEQQHAINDDFSRGFYYISESKFSELKAFQVCPGDLIISCSGTIGRVAEAPSWMEPGIINQALLKISLNQNALINNYFKILFSAYFMKTETLTDLQGTAQKNMVSVDTLKNEPFPLPPLAEQQRIVEKVDELMGLCDRIENRTLDHLAAHETLVDTLLDTLTHADSAAELADNWNRLAAHFDTLFTTEHSIDRLNQTILQLAVMGRLVPQDPTDEPASVLLEKIAAEKARLVKEGKIKKQKPLPEIDGNEIPYKIPIGWVLIRLDDICF